MYRKLYCPSPLYAYTKEAEDFIKLCTCTTPYDEWESLMRKYNLFDMYLECDSRYQYLYYKFKVSGEPERDRVEIQYLPDENYYTHESIELLAIIIARFHTLLFNPVFLKLMQDPNEIDPEDFASENFNNDDRGYLIYPGNVKFLHKRWKDYDDPIRIEFGDIK